MKCSLAKSIPVRGRTVRNWIVACCLLALPMSAMQIGTQLRAHDAAETCSDALTLPTTHLVSPLCRNLKPRRVVIVITHDRHDRLEEQWTFAQSLAKHLNSCSQFHVVVASERICRDCLPMRKGTFDESQLLMLSRKYNTDAVLYCEINRLSAYEPMQAELSMALIHVGEAIALVSARSMYDLKSESTLRSYLSYINETDSLAPLSVGRRTPSQFIDFSASRFSLGLTTVW